ncbi:MAG: DNA-3-methyladenine glycosylase [Actinomycetota bacterium]|nr:DNA-3-methyladenine glycosylase [Actinomycetota bacterium]
MSEALGPAFYDRPVVAVARDLVGCVLRHGDSSGRIVETEAYHHTEAACHAYVGLTARTSTLFGAPGTAYVYRSYGIHALVNAVCEGCDAGAAVLIRALEPLTGLEAMRARRGRDGIEELCSGPGKLTQALAIEVELNASSLVTGPLLVLPRPAGRPEPRLVASERIGITKAVELPWRFSVAGSRFVSRPRPPGVAPLRRAHAR